MPDDLIEGIDYTLDELGRQVYTVSYLTKLGYCCAMDCHNCPYQGRACPNQEGGIAAAPEQDAVGKVYLLWFVREGDEPEEDGLLIGVYASERAAVDAIERVRTKPGFVKYPKGFQIHSRKLGQDSWTDGYVRD